MLKRTLALLVAIPMPVLAAFVPNNTIVNLVIDTEVRSDGSATQTYERLIRIDTPQGVDLSGQETFSFHGKREKQEVIEAYTIKPDGEKVLVTPDRIKVNSAKADDVNPYFSDRMSTVIIFPQVEIGSQLYFKVVTTEIEPPLHGRFSDRSYFSPHRRYESATIRLTNPSEMKVDAISRNVEGTQSVLEDGRIQHLYKFRQDTAYPLEPDQVDYKDFAAGVEFSSFANYAELATFTQNLFAPKTRVTPKVQALADQITRGANTQRQKAQRLYDWVSKNIRYVGVPVGNNGYEPHYADEILEHMYGDCKDHAVILESLLLAIGIPSSPVLLNASDSYQLPPLAGDSYFDHAITYIPEFDLYLDSTAQFAEFGTLPANDMGKPTLITQTGRIHATPNSNSKMDYTVTYSKFKLLPDGSIEGTAKYEPHGYFVKTSRYAQFAYENKDTQSVVDSLLGRFHETGTGEMSHGDPTDLSSAWTVSSKFKLDPVINLPGPSAFTLPVGLAPGYIRIESGTKPYEPRRFPYACGSSKHVDHIELSLPKSLSVSRFPKGVVIATPDQRYRSSYRLRGERIFVTRELTTELNTDVCKPNKTQAQNGATFIRQMKSDLRSQIFVD